MRRVASLLAVALFLLSLEGPAQSAVPVVAKEASFGEHDGQLTVTMGFREMFDDELRRRLRSGFTMTVVMQVVLREERGSRPVAVAARTLRATYDLWDEVYLLETEEASGVRHETWRDQRDVVDRLTSVWRFPLCPRAALSPAKRYYVEVLAEVNPVSKEVLAEIRRWLRKPVSHEHVGRNNFFGSFVSVFLNDQVPRGERIFRARSPILERLP